jgi:hypothetical protein
MATFESQLDPHSAEFERNRRVMQAVSKGEFDQ